METWDAYRARRNVREFSTTAIPSEVLDQILEAGRRAPSAKNRQPWDFVVVTERAALEALSKVWVGAGHVARSAATIVIVTPVENGADAISHAEFDLGQATMAMALMAADHGIGSGHALAHDQEVVRSVIGLPPYASRCVCSGPRVPQRRATAPDRASRSPPLRRGGALAPLVMHSA
jgi:nitroreductase